MSTLNPEILQDAAHGSWCPCDYVDYIMGHTVDTHHDIQQKGIEFLRNIYAAAGLSVKPRSSYSKLDMLKELMRAWGLEPEKVLTNEALAEPHRTYATSEDREKEEIRLLGLALRDRMPPHLVGADGVVVTSEVIPAVGVAADVVTGSFLS